MKTLLLSACRLIAVLAVTQILVRLPGTLASADDTVSFQKSVVPVFKKYCLSCHNSEDNEGGLSLSTAAEIAEGGENGPALLPGNAKSSRMVRMMLDQLDPKMPPDDMAGPTQKELAGLMAWIDEGARIGKDISLAPTKLTVPNVDSRVATDPITDLAWSPDGSKIAIARYQRVEILDGSSKKLLFELKDHPGKVNSVAFSPDSKYLLASTGITGLKGLAIEWDLETQSKVGQYAGHSDVAYSAVFSPNQQTVATAGYDRKILIRKRSDGSDKATKSLTLKGHNGAIYDLQFSQSSQVLASASGDQTVKLWDVKSGKRLDTLGQPLKEQFVTQYHPNGRFLIGAGRDNRIRLWQVDPNSTSAVNPLKISRFAHEASIIGLAYSKDGSLLVTSAEDQTIKVWTGDSIELVSTLAGQSDVAYGIALSPQNELAVGRMDGSLDFYSLANPAVSTTDQKSSDFKAPPIASNKSVASPLPVVAEIEPNNDVQKAQPIKLPTKVTGKLFRQGESADSDYFLFEAQQGETWVFETNAARSKSPVDTKIAILTADGQRVPRLKLQAVRDSYFTFRGKDANTSDDFRVHNWEEMELNEYLYCNGEIVKLFLYPRGPDSGFKVYPGFGARHNFFDTTPTAHALQEPCYIVKAYAPDAKLSPNGLPTFDVFYENDDDAQRKLGSDSKLYFTAPAAGKYLVRVRDARNFQGEKFTYELTVRSAKPDFNVSFGGKKMTAKRGSGREFGLNATRIDNFNGPIEVLFENVPAGIRLPEKMTIQENHYKAFGSFFIASDAKQPTPEQIQNIKITAEATIAGKRVRKDLGKIAELKLEDSPRIQARLVHAYSKLSDKEKANLFTEMAPPVELVIQPGQTISASLVVKRNKHGGDIDFGNAESGRNLPHGVYVDNIGLNGLRIIKGQGDVREVFITAAQWVPEQDRLFHLRANNIDGETTAPVLLKVRK